MLGPSFQVSFEQTIILVNLRPAKENFRDVCLQNEVQNAKQKEKVISIGRPQKSNSKRHPLRSRRSVPIESILVYTAPEMYTN